MPQTKWKLGEKYWLPTGGYTYNGEPYYSEFSLEEALDMGYREEELESLPALT